MRLIRAVRELNAEHGTSIRVIALHTEDERRATFVRAADEAVVLRDTGTGIPYLDHDELGRALRASRADAAWVGWGFVAEDPAFAELCAVARRDVHRPAAGGHAPARRQDRGEGAGRADRRAGRAVERRPGRRRRGRAPARGHDRLPADHQVPQRRRRARHPHRPLRGRAGGGARAHPGRGAAHLRRPDHLHGAAGRGRPAHRGAGHRRPARQRVGARRPGLLGAAAQPEGHRGVELPGAHPRAGRVAARVRDRAGEGRRLRQRRHRRVPLPAGGEAVHLPRGQHPAAGRAPGHRGDDRPRHRQAAAPRGRRRPARGRPARRSSATPSRPGSTPRTPSRSFAPAPGHGRAHAPAHRPGRPRGHRHVRRRRHPADLRLDGRQDHRLGPRPARGAGPPARARCARPPSCSAAGRRRSPSCSTCWTARRSWPAPPTPPGWTAPAPAAAPTPSGDAWRRPGPGGDRRLRRRGGAGAGRVPRLRPRRAAPRLARGRADGRARLPRAGLPADRRARSAPTATGWSSTAATSTSTWTGSARWRAGSPSADERFSVVAVEAHRVAPGRGRRRHPPGHPGRGGRRPRARRPAVVVAVRVGAGRRRRGRPDDRRPREHEDGDGGAGAVRRPGPRGPGRGERAGRRRCRRCCASTAPATRPRRSSASGSPSRMPDGAATGRATDRALSTARGDAGPDHRLRRQRRARAGSSSPSTARPAASSRRTTDDELLHGELALLTTFADLSELSRNRPTSAEEQADEQVHSPREYFHTYLHSLDIEREALPESFRARLRRALRHYGVERPGARPGARGGGVPHLPGPAADGRPAARRPRAAGPLADRGRAADRSAARRGGRGARPADRRDPAALPVGRRPGPRGAVPVLREAARAAGPPGGRRPRPSRLLAELDGGRGAAATPRTSSAGSRRWSRAPSR